MTQSLDTPFPILLRRWAKGMYTTEAAVELLLRAFNGRFAQPGWEWIQLEADGSAWVNFRTLVDHIGVLSSGEQAFLQITASIGGAPLAMPLGDAVASIDRGLVELVLAGVAHAAGSHRHSRFGSTSLFPWPATASAGVSA